jgi:hypothetical protein
MRLAQNDEMVHTRHSPVSPRRGNALSCAVCCGRHAVRKAWDVEINNMWGCVEVGRPECDAH